LAFQYNDPKAIRGSWREAIVLPEADSDAARRARLRFGPFELDPLSGELEQDGVPVKLRLQPAKVLALLASQPGRLVTREEIKAALWAPDTHVDFEAGLNYCIKEIRAALGDRADRPAYVETLARRGYRFIARVAPKAGSPATPRARSRRLLCTAAAAAVLAAAAGGLAVFRHRGGASPLPARPLLAVLPFEDLSEGAGPGGFAEGLTEEVTVHLGRLQPAHVGVIARTTARGFATRPQPIAALRREFAVDYVVEGSVRISEQRAHVVTRLIRASDRRQRWTESFELQVEDSSEAQAQVARAVAAGIQLTLAPGKPVPLARLPRIDPETYRLYARGRAHWNRWSVKDLRRSVESFQDALRRKPEYALAHAGLAEAFVALADVSPEPPGDSLRAAKQAALRAVELDGSLAEAHAALGIAVAALEFDWASAERKLRRSIELSPHQPIARLWLSWVLRATGRLDEALEQIRVAEQLAPSSPIVGHNVGMVRLQRGDWAPAVERFRSVIAQHPRFALSHVGIGRALLQQGKYAEAIRSLELAVQLSEGNARYQAALANAYAVASRPSDAMRILAQLEAQPSNRDYDLALVFGGLGDGEQAVQRLERALQAKDPALRNLLLDERLKDLQDDRRWPGLREGLKARGWAPRLG
jgi:TolB-like protein/DNA-binding winged helix-turn-helix (wHTH) protein/Flp pilus assembly protein TadD